jgi:type IX secretion system PorP/SprF family membrane protein
MKHIYFIWPFCLLVGYVLYGQQSAQYSQWSFHQFALNPAHAGIKPCIDVHTLFRSQWVGFEGAPKSGFLSLSAPLRAKRKEFLSARHGIGMRFESDRIGQFNTNRFNIAYAGHFNFTRDNRLSLGLYGGVIQMGYNPSGSVTLQPDPQILRESNFVAPDASFGAWWNSKNYYTGLIIQNLLKYKWDGLGTNSFFRTHLLLNGGYRIRINDAVSVLPTILLKIPPRAPWTFDLQANIDIRNLFDVGLGYRNTDALIFFAGYKLNQKLSIIYSFDLTTSAIRNYSNNTHEISLSFNACRSEKTAAASCPLFE